MRSYSWCSSGPISTESFQKMRKSQKLRIILETILLNKFDNFYMVKGPKKVRKICSNLLILSKSYFFALNEEN